MILNKIKLVIIILILFISGCTKKDELTLPVKIHLKIGSNLENQEWVDIPEDTILNLRILILLQAG